MSEDEETSRLSGVARVRGSTARAALTGALIGALAGLGGSALAYVQAERDRQAATQERRADLRREAYTGFSTEFQVFRTKTWTMRNFIWYYGGEITKAELEKEHNETFIPASERILQAEVAARIVATPRVRAMLDKSSKEREFATSVIEDKYSGRTTEGNSVFNRKLRQAMADYEKTVRAIMNEAINEVL